MHIANPTTHALSIKLFGGQLRKKRGNLYGGSRFDCTMSFAIMEIQWMAYKQLASWTDFFSFGANWKGI